MEHRKEHSLLVARALFESQIAEASEWKSEWLALVAGVVLLVLLAILLTCQTFTGWFGVLVLLATGAALVEFENRNIKRNKFLIKKLNNHNQNY